MPGNRTYSSFTRTPNNNQLLLIHLNNIKLFGELVRDSSELLLNENVQRTPIRTNRNDFNNFSFSSNNQPSSNSFYSYVRNTPSSSVRNTSSSASTSASTSASASTSSTNNEDLSSEINFLLQPGDISQFYLSLENLLTRNNTNRTNRNNGNNGNNSFNILTINRDNSNVLLNTTPPVNEIYDITEYELIQNPTNDICPITRDSFYNNQNVYMICKCKHIFNKTALNMWLEQNDICPYCRTSVRL